MARKCALFFMLALLVAAISGCETTKGTIEGAKLDLQTAHQQAAKGWQALLDADDWMRRNLW